MLLAEIHQMSYDLKKSIFTAKKVSTCYRASRSHIFSSLSGIDVNKNVMSGQGVFATLQLAALRGNIDIVKALLVEISPMSDDVKASIFITKIAANASSSSLFSTVIV